MAGKAQQKKHKKIKDEISNVLTLPNRQTLTEMMAEVVSRSKTGQLKSGDLAFYSQFQKIKVLYLKLSEEIEYLKTLHKQTSVSNDDGPTPETVAKIQTPAIDYLSDTNFLTPDEYQAAMDISKAYNLIIQPVKVRVFKYEERTGHSEPRDQTPAEIALKHKFNIWMNDMLARRYHAGVAHDAIVADMSLNDLQRRWGGRKTNISERIKEALVLYCEVVKR